MNKKQLTDIIQRIEAKSNVNNAEKILYGFCTDMVRIINKSPQAFQFIEDISTNGYEETMKKILEKPVIEFTTVITDNIVSFEIHYQNDLLAQRGNINIKIENDIFLKVSSSGVIEINPPTLFILGDSERGITRCVYELDNNEAAKKVAKCIVLALHQFASIIKGVTYEQPILSTGIGRFSF